MTTADTQDVVTPADSRNGEAGRLFAPAPGSASGDITSDSPCWCGEPHPYYAPIRRRCGGSGYVDCICGGDSCVCHNHGEVECFGCKDCED